MEKRDSRVTYKVLSVSPKPVWSCFWYCGRKYRALVGEGCVRLLRLFLGIMSSGFLQYPFPFCGKKGRFSRFRMLRTARWRVGMRTLVRQSAEKKSVSC